MALIQRILSALVGAIIGIAVMAVVATVVFFVAVWVVATAAGLAGLDPSSDFVLLCATLMVVAIILTGGFTPRLSNPTEIEEQHSDPAYN